MEISPNIQPTELELELDPKHLKDVCIPFDFANPPVEPIRLSNSLTLAREKWKGIGLAANQVGLQIRVISIKGIDSCLFNPKIVSTSKDNVVMEEGCLSFPGLIVKIKRPLSIRVRYINALGETKTATYNGMTARCIQHEIDHLDGITFYNKANLFHREQAFRKWNK